MALLEVRALSRSFYGVHALNGVDLDVEAGTITGLIGPNGARHPRGAGVLETTSWPWRPTPASTASSLSA